MIVTTVRETPVCKHTDLSVRYIARGIKTLAINEVGISLSAIQDGLNLQFGVTLENGIQRM